MTPVKPFLGSKRWAVVLCQFNDQQSVKPHTADFFQRWITRGSGINGINDFFHDVSYGKCNLDGSQVFDWKPLSYTLADDKKNNRYQRIVNAATEMQNRVQFTDFYGICIIHNVDVDSGSLDPGIISLHLNDRTQDYGVAVLGPWGWQPSVACQEFAHGFGMSAHSRVDADPTIDYGNPFDIMSTRNAYMFTDSQYDIGNIRYDNCGPGMNTPNLDTFGWVDADRIYNVPTTVLHREIFGRTQTAVETFTIDLSAVNHPETGHHLCATIDAGTDALGGFTYYIEYRTADGWDRGMALAGIPDCIVVQQARTDRHNYLVTTPTRNCLRAGQSYLDTANNIKITAIGFSNHTATVTVTLPVHHIYQSPVDGPNRPDWHIYETLNDHINVTERRLQSIRSMIANLQHISK